MMQNRFSIESFLEEGLILQTKEKIFISSAPFYFQNKLHPSQINFYAPDFFLKKNEFITGNHVQSVLLEEMLDFLTSYQERHSSPSWLSPDFHYFNKQFDDFKNSKNLIKAVPVVFARSFFIPSPKKKAFLLKNLLEKQAGFVYGYWTSNQGLLGVTPEYLFEKKGKYITTMALAGTGLASSSLMTDKKEVQEHQIVVDDLSSLLHGLHLKRFPMYEKTFGSLKHLQTDIEFQSDMSFLSLVQKLHPTAALGGSPKIEALQWLLKYNRMLDRRRFGAPFALHFPNGDSFALTAIRNIQWDKKSVILGSGCGLTAKSKLEKEWLELELKRKWVLRQLWE